MSGTGTMTKKWDDAIKECEKFLGEKEYKMLSSIDSEAQLIGFYKKQGQSGLDRIEKVEPIIRKLKKLYQVISIFCPGSGPIESLIWGSFTCIFESASKFLDVYQDMMQMWQEITVAMVRFDIYANAFKDVPIVETALVSVFVEYIRFCGMTMKFLKRRPFHSLIRLGWSGEKAKFTKLLQDIHREVDNADKAANAAQISASRDRHGELVSLIRSQSQTPQQVDCKVLRYPRSSTFHDRPEILEEMHKYLEQTASGSGLRTFALYGMGGIGKTQLALEYCYRNQTSFPAIFWISADRQEKMFQDFGTASQCLSLNDSQSMDQRKIRDNVLVWMSKHPRQWLLVFDNVDDPADLAEFWPLARSRGSILLTSRNSTIVPGLSSDGLEIESLNKSESATLLLSVSKIPDSPVDRRLAEDIGEELAGLPLAITQMAAFIFQTGCPLNEFLQLYRARGNHSKIQRSSNTLNNFHYRLTLANVWEMSISRLGDPSKGILEVLALLDGDAIPESLLKDSGQMEGPEFLDANLEYYSAVTQLRQHCLIKAHGDPGQRFLSLHRLVQKYTRSHMHGGTAETAFVRTIRILRHWYPAYSNIGLPMSDLWGECKKLTGHVAALSLNFSEMRPNLSREDLALFAELLHVTSQYLWEQGSWREAWRILRLAEKYCKLDEGPNLVLRAHIACGLGVFCLEDSQIEEGAKYNELYVDLRKQYNASLGNSVGRAEILMLSNAYNNLGNAYCAQERFADALQTHREALQLRKKEHEPLYIALSEANISRTLQFMGRLDESKEYLDRALQAQASLTGVEDTRYALYLHNMGSLLSYLQRWEDSKSTHLEALRIREAKLGDVNDTAVSHHMVGSCHFQLREYQDAAQHLEKAIQTFEQGLNSQDRVARSCFKLAQVCDKLQQTAEAAQLRHRALEIRRSLTGEVQLDVGTEEDYDKLTVYQHR